MFRINRIKIIVKTPDGQFGFDETFDKRINFIASNSNTKGKSSCIEAIYYCLGLEEIIGGKNEKALNPVFRKTLKYKNKEIEVLESEFYLEVQNTKNKIITIYRSANKENYKANLITVYDGQIDSVFLGKVKSEDMYVHMGGAAVNRKGFHRFLEEFIGWELPEVPAYDDTDKKLYIQTIFSALFIEQKRGWSEIFANIPTYFKIREPQKRVVEFLIQLETLKNEKLKQLYKKQDSKIKSEWNIEYNEIFNILRRFDCDINGLPKQPQILDDDYINKVTFIKIINEDNIVLLEEYLEQLREDVKKIKTNKITVGSNIDNIQLELVSKNEEVMQIENLLVSENEKVFYEKNSLKSLLSSLEVINKDLINNKDAKKIKNLGSSENWNINKDICPTCHQKIHDSLLPQNIDYYVMDIEENICHLESQKSMLEFAIEGHRQNIKSLEDNISKLQAKLFTLRRIIRSLKNDIESEDNSLSETDVHKKILMENKLENLISMKENIKEKIKKFNNLSERWKELLTNKKNLPHDKFTENDKKHLQSLITYLRKNLEEYGYKSIENFLEISISEDKYLPISEGFDMTLDSSASDNIRAIWAFTVALMQTSEKHNLNHPNILIFDEPDQQSVIVKDMEKFLTSIIEFKSECQVIIGITLKDIDTRTMINGLDKEFCKIILLEDKAIVPINTK